MTPSSQSLESPAIPGRFKVFISGRKRGLTPTISKELGRRSAIEPIIGHMKEDGKLDRNYLKGTLGDKINAILCGSGHNLRIILRKLREFLPIFARFLLTAINLILEQRENCLAESVSGY